MKKLLSVLLTVLMALCVCTINIAAEGEEVDEFVKIDGVAADPNCLPGNDPSAKTGLVFDGNEQELINPGDVLGYEYRYRIQGNTNWTSKASNIKGVDAGTYTIEWQKRLCVEFLWIGKIHKLDVVIDKGEEPEVKVVDIPKAINGLEYNGETQTGVEEGEGYTLTNYTATEPGTYTATATLSEGYTWPEGETEPVTIEWSIAKKTLRVMLANMTGYANENGEAEFFISNFEELQDALNIKEPTFEYKEGDSQEGYKPLEITKEYLINDVLYPVIVMNSKSDLDAYQIQVVVNGDNPHYKASPTAFQVNKTPLYLGLTDLTFNEGQAHDESFTFSIKLRFGASNDNESKDLFILTIDNMVIPEDKYTYDFDGTAHILDLSYDFLKFTLNDDYANTIESGEYELGLHMISGQSRGESFNCYSKLTVNDVSSTSKSSSSSQTLVNKETKKDSIMRIVSTGVE